MSMSDSHDYFTLQHPFNIIFLAPGSYEFTSVPLALAVIAVDKLIPIVNSRRITDSIV